jgi:hypothetical protein
MERLDLPLGRITDCVQDIVEVADSKSIATYVMGAYSALSRREATQPEHLRAMSAPAARRPARKGVKPPTKPITEVLYRFF